MTTNQFTTFLKNDLPRVLNRLKPDAKPLWGILTPQHMIEHVVGSWRVSNGNAEARQFTPPELLQEQLDFLYSDRDFEKLVKNPIMPDGLWPLRKKSLDDAIAQLHSEIADFFTYFDAHPDARPVHPIFGPLDREGWLTFQQKHMKHHLRQFGLV